MKNTRVDRVYWGIIILLAVATIVMSMIGWYYDSSTDKSLPFSIIFLDILDKTLLVFVGEGRDPIDDGNYLVRIARIISVVVIAGAIVKLVLELLVKRWENFKISRLKNHMIICGLGEGGNAFAQNLSTTEKIIVVDPSLSEADAFNCEENGWHYLKADARESAALLKAGLAKAHGMIITCGDDTVNLEVLELATEFFSQNKHLTDFTFLLELNSAQLSESISDQFLSNELDDSIELYTFSRPELTARQFVWNVQLSEYARFRNQCAIHLVLIGFDDYASAMIDKLVSATVVNGLGAMKVSIFSDESDYLMRRQLDKYIHAVDFISVKHYPKERSRLVLKESEFHDVTAVFVFAEDDKTCVREAIAQRDFLIQYNQDKAPIFMRLDRDFAMKDLLVSTDDTYRMGEVLQAFGMNDHICHPGLITGELENIAKQLHEQYLVYSTKDRDEEQKQIKISSYQPWRKLPYTKKNANRRSVDHLPSKLASLGFYHKAGFGLSLPATAPYFSDDPSLLERLAETEQRSWSAGRYAEGWIPGEHRNDRRKIHDCLQYRYHQLSETLKGYDRDQIKLLDHNIFSRNDGDLASNQPETIIQISADFIPTADDVSLLTEYVETQLVKLLLTSEDNSFYTLEFNLQPNAATVVVDLLSELLKQSSYNWRTVIQSDMHQEALFNQFISALTESPHLLSFNQSTSTTEPASRLNSFLKRTQLEWIISDTDTTQTCTSSMNIPSDRNFVVHVTQSQQQSLSTSPEIELTTQINEHNTNIILAIQR